MTANLTVPDASMHTVWSLLRNTKGMDTHNAVAAAQMIAAPIVAAELRRLADRVRVQRDTVMKEQPRRELDAALQLLSARADELDPEGKP